MATRQPNSPHLTRRRLLASSVGTLAAVGAGAVASKAAASSLSSTTTATTTATTATTTTATTTTEPTTAHTIPDRLGPVLGTILDYSAGVPSAAVVAAKGYLGAIRYVSQPRPGETWMVGKPVSRKETTDFTQHGLATASVYQFGRATTADWLKGAAGVAVHAPQAIALHQAAGGPKGVPIYVAIDDNPTLAQFNSLISPYLATFQTVLTNAGYRMGVYGNYYTIDWCLEDGIGEYFWQHNWGSNGKIHHACHLHQFHNSALQVDGVTVDLNHVYQSDWGQWTPSSMK